MQKFPTEINLQRVMVDKGNVSGKDTLAVTVESWMMTRNHEVQIFPRSRPLTASGKQVAGQFTLTSSSHGTIMQIYSDDLLSSAKVYLK